MRINLGAATLLLGVLCAAAPATTQPIGPDEPPLITLPEETENALRKGAEELRRALEDALNRLPKLSPPRIDDDGNLIIPAPRWREIKPIAPADEPVEI